MFDAEQTTDSAIATLKAALPAKVAAINAAKNDFVLPVPDDASYSLGSSEVLRYPWVEVAVTNSDVSGLSLGQGAGDQTSQVIVAVRYQSPFGEQLDRALRRYASAVAEALMAPDAFGGHDTVAAIRFAYGTNPEVDDKMMLNGVAVVGFSVEGVATL